jgi:threonine/homoserine/homoserine lactone efflux protein
MNHMSLSSYVTFCRLCAALAVSPGPDSLLILRFSLQQMSSGIAAALGSALGNVLWALMVAIGLAALIEQSAEAYRALNLIGGLYLFYLGTQAVRGRKAGMQDPATIGPGATGVMSSAGAGLLSCMLNPKVGLFFLAVVPQFVPEGGSVFPLTMLLGGTLAVIVLIYLAVLCLFAAKASAWLKQPKGSRTMEKTSGLILCALGIGTAVSAY